jgi:hypothetical protein
MSPNERLETIEERLRAVEELPQLFDELQSILAQPTPPDRTDAAAQREAKSCAQEALQNIRGQLVKAVPLALKRLQEIIDILSLPPDNPSAAALQEIKHKAQTASLQWDAHYGTGDPHAGMGPKDDENA